eukprot:3178447-Karenia_brevis.AAC.1
MKEILSVWQSSSVLLWLRLNDSYVDVAAMASRMDECTVSCRRPEVTAKSSAAGGPARQRGSPFSGTEPWSGRGGRRPGFSSSGLRPALTDQW